MALRIKCKCGHAQKISSKMAGKTLICPGCKKLVMVPAVPRKKSEATAPTSPAPQSPAPPSPTTATSLVELVPPPADLTPGLASLTAAGNATSAKPAARDGLVCPSCQQPLAAHAKICVNCGFDLRTGRALVSSVASDVADGSHRPPPPPRWPGAQRHSSSPPEPETCEIVEVRFGQKWLLIIGLAILVLGVGYFLKYAFDQNWIGPPVRVALAYLLGLLCIGGGELFRRRQFPMFGLYLAGGGIAVLYFAGYAAFQVYGLVNQPIAFGLMIFVTAAAGVLALFHDCKWLAVLGIIGGFASPVVLNTGTDNQVALMFYMAILNAAIIGIAAFKRWNLLSYLGFACTWALFAGWYYRYYAPPKFWATIVFLNLFFLIYAFLPFVHATLRRDKLRTIDFAVTVPNAFVAFGYSYVTIRDCFSLRAVSIVSIAYAALFLGAAVFLRRRARENTEAFALLAGKGLLFVILTVPLLFSKHWITIFWTAQAVALLWAALRIKHERLRQVALALLLLATAKFAIHDYPTIFQFHAFDASRIFLFAYISGFKYLLIERWITTVLVLAGLIGSALMLKAAEANTEDLEPDARKFVRGACILLLFLMLNFEVAGYFHDYARAARFASISVLWALFAVALMVLGFLRNKASLRYCAIALFIATIGKVLLWDMANISTPYRILSFLVLGVMLIGASYLYHRHKGRILATALGDETPH